MSKKWQLLLPMAGRGSRFTSAGYKLPKPFIQVQNVPMYQIVLDNLITDYISSITLICLSEHKPFLENIDLEFRYQRPVKIVFLENVTDGAARTVQKGLGALEMDEPVLIANSDQYLDCSMEWQSHFLSQNIDGVVLTSRDNDSKWSFARVVDGWVVEIAEKEVISNIATVGIYGFKSGNSLKWAIEQMINKSLRVNGEFYLAPCYNQLVSRGDKIAIHHAGDLSSIFYGLGTPEDLELFLLALEKKTITSWKHYPDSEISVM